MKKYARLVYESSESERPFFLFLTLILAGMYFWVVFTTPTLRKPGALILFTLLMILHIGLHWLAPLLERRIGLIPAYIIGQGLLAFVITYLSGNVGMIFGTYLALIGEAFGIIRMSSWGRVAIGGYLLLSLINYGLLVGWENIWWWAVGVLPSTLFIAIYVTLYSRQSEARARAQALSEDLEAANRQLSEYAAQVEDLTIVSERQRMARELHDTLSQGLAGVILQLEAVDAHLANNQTEWAQVIVKQTMQRARATLSEARRALGDLRYGQTTPVNMEDMIRQESDHFTQATGIPCDVVINLPADLLIEQPDTIRRAVAEGLTNVGRHAQASRASVRLERDGSALLVKIYDNGRGFDPRAVPPGHYGLLGMHERARLAGGSLDIQSAPGAGTTVLLRLPVSQEFDPSEGTSDVRDDPGIGR